MRTEATGFPVTLDLEGQKVLLLAKRGDDGSELEKKLFLLERAGAMVVKRSRFVPEDLDGARLVMVATRDARLTRRVFIEAKTRGILIWSSDDPEHSDLAMPAIVARGKATIAISTSGQSPALAAALRAALESGFDEKFARFVLALGRARKKVRSTEQKFSNRRKALREKLHGFALTTQLHYPDWFK